MATALSCWPNTAQFAQAFWVEEPSGLASAVFARFVEGSSGSTSGTVKDGGKGGGEGRVALGGGRNRSAL